MLHLLILTIWFTRRDYASTDLCDLLFLFPLLFILQALLLLPGDHLCEAVVIGAGLGVLCGGDLWVIVDDDNAYRWQRRRKKKQARHLKSVFSWDSRIVIERE